MSTRYLIATSITFLAALASATTIATVVIAAVLMLPVEARQPQPAQTPRQAILTDYGPVNTDALNEVKSF